MDSLKYILSDIEIELKSAKSRYQDFNSLHEAYAVLLEEVDELWDLVRKKNSHLKGEPGRDECIQIAAMAIRTIIDRELI